MLPEQLRNFHTFADLWHPWVLAWLLLAQVVFLLAVGPWRRNFRWGPPATARQKWLVSAAIWTVYLGEGTPLHVLSEVYLFSAHMLQHILLTMIVPPLLVLGIPAWMWQALIRPRWVKAVFRVVTRPAPALLLFNLIYSLWHLPVAYQASLWWHWFHMVQHIILVATAIFMWWPICSQVPEVPPLTPGAQMLYIFISGVCQIAVFAMITFAEHPFYDFYAQAPRLWGISSLVDQQLAGLIMKVGGMAVYLIALGIIFFQWAAREERQGSAARANS